MNVDNIVVNTQSSIKLVLDKVVYFDPYKIEDNVNDADIIFITHDHYDHFDRESIDKVKNQNTIIVAPKTMEKAINKIEFKKYLYLNPNEEINIDDINVKTIPAYNILKPFHPKLNKWLGYVIKYNNMSYYIAGDTDKTNEALTVATELVKIINPKIVIPIHYGSIVGNKEDGKKLKDNLIDTTIEVVEKLL